MANITYVSIQDRQDMESTVTFFVDDYVSVYGLDVYSWRSDGGTVNYGVFKITSRGIRELHYISIVVR